jgi:hypothetical protein
LLPGDRGALLSIRESILAIVEFSIQLGDHIHPSSVFHFELVELQVSVRSGEDAVAK